MAYFCLIINIPIYFSISYLKVAVNYIVDGKCGKRASINFKRYKLTEYL